MSNRIVFSTKETRRARVQEQWYLSIVGTVSAGVCALTDGDNPSDYWRRMTQREQKTSGMRSCRCFVDN